MKTLLTALLLLVATAVSAYDFDANMEAIRDQQQENYMRMQQQQMQDQQFRQQQQIEEMQLQQQIQFDTIPQRNTQQGQGHPLFQIRD
jgi:hemolysin activation/secretion protein